jgi:hypothetical protein
MNYSHTKKRGEFHPSYLIAEYLERSDLVATLESQNTLERCRIIDIPEVTHLLCVLTI